MLIILGLILISQIAKLSRSKFPTRAIKDTTPLSPPTITIKLIKINPSIISISFSPSLQTFML